MVQRLFLVLFAEMTGQNFVDEDTEVEKASHMGNAKRMRTSAKRMRTSVVSKPSNDQVCFYPLIIMQFAVVIMLLMVSHFFPSLTYSFRLFLLGSFQQMQMLAAVS